MLHYHSRLTEFKHSDARQPGLAAGQPGAFNTGAARFFQKEGGGTIRANG
jgi:hypothetical protein